MDEPWEHPDWYDLHDDAFTAGPEREPEHYREFMLSLPPLDPDDHLVDLGAGTGKLACMIASGYRELGWITLVEPNERKLGRAHARLGELLPDAAIQTLVAGLGTGEELPEGVATLTTVGSVYMPIMEIRGGTHAEGLDWLRAALGESLRTLREGGWLYAAETMGLPWARGGLDEPARRLSLPEFTDELGRAGFEEIEVRYRFRDRVVVRGRRGDG